MRNSGQALSNWQEQYLTSSRAYPIAVREAEIIPLLRAPFTRAVIVRDPQFAFDPSNVVAIPDENLANRYWFDPAHPRKRLASGQVVRVEPLTSQMILDDSMAANIQLNPECVDNFTAKCNAIRDMFERVYNQYSNKPFKALRSFTLFTPIGGRGRSPEIHIDNTILTVHWSAALATLKLHDGDLSDDIWDALSMIKRKLKSPENQNADFARLVELAKTLQMVDNKIGDVCITKGQLGLDLSDPVVRQQMCVHVSSPTIIQNGQAGFLMTPEMPKPPNPMQ